MRIKQSDLSSNDLRATTYLQKKPEAYDPDKIIREMIEVLELDDEIAAQLLG